MRRLAAVLLAAIVAVPAAAALDRPQAQALLRLAVKASGLKQRATVRIVVESPVAFAQRRVRMLDRTYPRSAQALDEEVYRALGLHDGPRGTLRRSLLAAQMQAGLYDPATRTVYLRRGPTERRAALPELVHALADEHYDTGRLFRIVRLRDEKVAALAAVEGHARLAVNTLAPRRTAARRASRLDRFVALERGFLHDVGLRFAATLRNLGGVRALRGSLQRFPATSEQVFHLDKYLERERARPIALPVDAAGLTLAGANTFGELDVRALLAVFAVPGLDRVGNGWGGGRTAVYRGPAGSAVLVALDWDAETDSAHWAGAIDGYVDAAFHAETPGPPPVTECAASTCWEVAGRGIAFVREGRRTALVVAGDTAGAAALARAIVP